MTKKQKRMKEIVNKFQKYVETYDKQHGYLDYTDNTFIDDMLYGIGIAISGDYKFAQGFFKFKELLRKEGVCLTMEPEDYNQLFFWGELSGLYKRPLLLRHWAYRDRFRDMWE